MLNTDLNICICTHFGNEPANTNEDARAEATQHYNDIQNKESEVHEQWTSFPWRLQYSVAALK